ncbi:membrane-associated protein, putative [Bodo saltans]|uniref:Membrane-associated protein, putative n=1 Tax=Bodo saltans TaxID=75058 RepID=A0A0S4J3C4_BODSA|nr:membrane-associated protein, putative [Bodo saltans]|eukprot:CUG76659.1 membrane-associated protein, putative [Bodo saltans]
MRISIKTFVALLLVVVSLIALVLSSVPTIDQVHDNAMNFVLQAAEGSADQAQYVLAAQLLKLRKFGDVLYKAAHSPDIINGLLPWHLVSWAGATVSANDFGVTLFRQDDRGFVLTTYNTIYGIRRPGYIFLTNLSNPGVSITTGFFSPNSPFRPGNLTSPWTVSNSSVRFSIQPVGLAVAQPNRSLSMQWVGLTALQTTPTTVLSLLTYGGPIHVDGNASNRQYLLTSMRGTALSNYLKAMPISQSGSLVLFDLVTRSFVAGSISDIGASIVNNGTTPRLTPLSSVRDPRVASIVHASYAATDAQWGNTPLTSTGLYALVTCVTPCTFVYWPHDNTLRQGPFWSRFNLDVLVHSFIVVRVVDVNNGAVHSSSSTTSAMVMNLRLMVTVPSDDIVREYINGVQDGLLISFVVICGLCILTTIVAHFVFAALSYMEQDILGLAWVFLFSPMETHVRPHLEGETQQNGDVNLAMISVFKEYSRIWSALKALSRALYTLRAFSPAVVTTPAVSRQSATATTVSKKEVTTIGASVSRGVVSPSESSSLRGSISSPLAIATIDGSQSQKIIEVPYSLNLSANIESSGLWHVPVTSMFVVMDPFMFDPQTEDPMAIHTNHRVILEAFQKFVGQVPGASIDQFYGNRMLIHLNASGRTHKHVLSALSIALKALRVVPQGVSVGVSSSVSLCGYMGPAACKVFTVVSTNVPHAAVMARLVPQLKTLGDFRVLLTWRAVEAAQQEQRTPWRKLGSAAIDPVALNCGFRPIVKVELPGEQPALPPYAFTFVPALPKNLRDNI